MQSEEKMKYFVTGGAGFIGHHLIRRLLRDENEVICFDNLSTGKYDNIKDFIDHDNFTFVSGDVCDKNTMCVYISTCDIIVHFASAVGVKLIMSDYKSTLETGIIGTQNVIDLAIKYEKKLLFASTSEVYGKSDKHSFNENDQLIYGNPQKIRWIYALTKAIDEMVINYNINKHSLKAMIVRFFNIVGVNQSPEYGMVIPRFIGQALRNEPLTVYGSGKQTRCFTSILDTVNVLDILLKESDFSGEVYNIGNDEAISIIELAKLVIELTKSESDIKLISYDQSYGAGFEDIQARKPDNNKLVNHLGFNPFVTSLNEVLLSIVSDEFSSKKSISQVVSKERII